MSLEGVAALAYVSRWDGGPERGLYVTVGTKADEYQVCIKHVGKETYPG